MTSDDLTVLKAIDNRIAILECYPAPRQWYDIKKMLDELKAIAEKNLKAEYERGRKEALAYYITPDTIIPHE